jgi:hypothetical protein
MRLILFLMMITGAATAIASENTIAQKCMRTAEKYANENGGKPWSDNANFENYFGNICVVRVRQICDVSPYDSYNLRYIIDMVTWTVNHFEVDGCVNWP